MFQEFCSNFAALSLIRTKGLNCGCEFREPF